MNLSKKVIGATIALGVAFTMFQPSFSYAESVGQPEKVIQQVDTSVSTIKLPSVKKIETYIQKSPVKRDNRTVRNVNSKEAFFRLLDQIYTELPNQVTMVNSISKEDAENWHSEYQEQVIPSRMNNMHTLASYSIKKQGKMITITDKSNKKYSAKQIEGGIKAFAKDFSTQIKHLETDQKIKVIYDYIYSQYQYKANSYSEMLVGNAYAKTLACNGFSRLFYELAVASGVEAKMIESDDHFYNHVKTSNGQWGIVDVTTDILLKTKHGATGLSKEDYLKYVSKVGFYWATPVSRETAVATSWTAEQKEAFTLTSIPSLSY